MKVDITLDIAEFIGLPWDSAIPIPNTGDLIIYLTSEGSRAGEITSRTFSIGIDPLDNQKLTKVILKAE